MKSLKFDTKLFSSFRECLMGIAILGVLLLHAFAWTGSEHLYLSKILGPLGRTVFTEGFIFLSGFGLYYSFSNNNNIYVFYKRRVERFFIPFIMMAFPFYFLDFCCGNDSFVLFLLKESSLYFWIYGNNGMWYISIIIFLYMIFPLLYNIIFKYKIYKSILFKIIVLIFITYIIIISIYFINESYYDLIKIGITKIPMFLIGMIMAYMSKENMKLNIYYFICICLMLIINFILKNKFTFFIPIYEISYRLLSIPIICVCLNYFKSKIQLILILEWFGKYSLEIYVLHLLLIDKIKILFNILKLNNSAFFYVLVTYIIVLLLCKPIHNLIDKQINYIKSLNL